MICIIYHLITKDVEFYKKGDYMICGDKYLQQLLQNRNNGFPKIIAVGKPINECLDDSGFTIVGATDFLLRFIK